MVPVVVSGSIMRHVTVINSTEGVVITGRPPRMNHVSIVNSLSNGLTFDSFLRGEFVLENCSVSGSKEHGIKFGSTALLYNAKLRLNACRIETNGQTGIYVKSNVNMTITGSLIRSNVKSGCKFYGRNNNIYEGSGLIVVDENKISENKGYGFLFEGTINVMLSNNEFARNTFVSRYYAEAFLYLRNNRHTDVEIRNNTFVDNIHYYHYQSWGRRLVNKYTVYLVLNGGGKLQVGL